MGLRHWGAAMIVGGAVVSAAAPVAAGALSPGEKQEIEVLIRDYILKNPEVILESVRAMQEKQQQATQAKAGEAVAANRSALLRDSTSPSAGNPDGDVTVVEFFDYRCGYCKRVVPTLEELLRTDPRVRWVFKEFPILGPESLLASKIALAVWNTAPDKYLPFHVALMQTRGELTEARMLDVAKKVGVDPVRLNAARNDPGIAAKIEQTLALGQELNITGTPAFVVGDQVVPGAVDLATLRKLIADARAG